MKMMKNTALYSVVNQGNEVIEQCHLLGKNLRYVVVTDVNIKHDKSHSRLGGGKQRPRRAVACKTQRSEHLCTSTL